MDEPITGSQQKDSKLNQITKLVASIRENEASQSARTFEIRDSLLGSNPKEEAQSEEKPPVQGILERIIEDLNVILHFQERTGLNINDIFIATK